MTIEISKNFYFLFSTTHNLQKTSLLSVGGKGTCIVKRIQKNQPDILLTHLAYIAVSQGVVYLLIILPDLETG